MVGVLLLLSFWFVSVSVVCNFKQSRQFEKFSLKSGDIKVDVLRDEQHQHISMHLFVLSLLVIIMVLAIAKGLPLAGRQLWLIL